MRLNIVLAIGSLLTTACDITYKLSDVVEVKLDQCTQDSMGGQGEAIFAQAVANWNGIGAHFVMESDLNGATPSVVIEVKCGNLGENTIAEYQQWSSQIVINQSNWYPSGDPNYFTGVMVADHEMGHALSLRHNTNPNSVMFYQIHDYAGFTPQDLADLQCAQTNVDCSNADINNSDPW